MNSLFETSCNDMLDLSKSCIYTMKTVYKHTGIMGCNVYTYAYNYIIHTLYYKHTITDNCEVRLYSKSNNG